MDFLKDINFTDPTIIAAIIAVFGVIIGGVFLICVAFISRGKKAKVETLPSTPPPTPSPPPVIQQPSSFQSLHQIPPPDGDFIGREKELQELLDRVKQSGVHISGIRGMGGIGKTQLAYRLAEKLKPEFPDAQIYLDLKGVTEKDEQIPLKPEEALTKIIQAPRAFRSFADNRVNAEPKQRTLGVIVLSATKARPITAPAAQL